MQLKMGVNIHFHGLIGRNDRASDCGKNQILKLHGMILFCSIACIIPIPAHYQLLHQSRYALRANRRELRICAQLCAPVPTALALLTISVCYRHF